MEADLHLHTRYSDGTFSPVELAERARQAGLHCIALTDHDTVSGCHEASLACAERNLRFVPGTELTAEYAGHEVHILGYFVDTSNSRFLAALREFQAIRTQRLSEMVHRLNALGIALTVDQVTRIANCDSPGRPHVARALVQAKICGSFDEAFERFLKKGKPGWVPKARLEAQAAIHLIHEAQGSAVLAHPALYQIDSLIPEILQLGLDGIECYHSKHTAKSSQFYLELAHSLGCVATGGSDCHGYAKKEPLIGTIRVDAQCVDELEYRIHQRTLKST